MENRNVDEYQPEDKILTEEEILKLKSQESRLVSDHLATKIEKEARKYWDLFYKRNESRFFKDRHWTIREFNELLHSNSEKKILLEIGCGTGNLVYPLLEENSYLFIYACDFSPRAINLVKSNPLYNENHIKALLVDITTNDILSLVSEECVDIITLIFVLSTIHPTHYDSILKLLYILLQPGGVILIRDYGIYDMTQLRFKGGHKISENFYMRQDGTRSFFFSVGFLRDLFVRNGFQEITNLYVKRRTINVKESIDVPRTFVQAKFLKPF